MRFRVAARRSRTGALRLVPQNATEGHDGRTAGEARGIAGDQLRLVGGAGEAAFAICNPPVGGVARRLARLVARQQTAALAATLVDYAVMTACASGAAMSPARATACGALVGMFVGFVLGRRWVFAATGASALGQAGRYFAVSLVSLVANAGGEAALVAAGLHYLAARPIVSITVGLGWNLPLQQFFVFRRAAAPPSA